MSKWIEKNGVEAFILRVLAGITLITGIALVVAFGHTIPSATDAEGWGVLLFCIPTALFMFSYPAIDAYERSHTAISPRTPVADSGATREIWTTLAGTSTPSRSASIQRRLNIVEATSLHPNEELEARPPHQAGFLQLPSRGGLGHHDN